MKISRLYSNRDDVFPPIAFHDGLNVIFARVLARKDNTKDSHNLGKTLAIDLLDFCLLKRIDKEFFLKKHEDRFRGLVFFLEIGVHGSDHVTLRRAVDEASKVSVKRHPAGQQTLADLPEKSWDHWRLPLNKAVEWLDSTLALQAIAGWSYRDGHTFFLRKQKDFGDVFELHKFSKGKDREWKPFVAHMLGLQAGALVQKYELDEQLEEVRLRHEEARRASNLDENEFDRLKGQIEILDDQIGRKERELDGFDFHGEEIAVTRRLAEDVEVKIEKVNNEVYNLRYDLEQARKGLTFDLQFDLPEIERIFNEAKLHFPAQVRQGYENLVDFNRKIQSERKEHLQERVASLEAALQVAIERHRQLSEQRKRLLSTLRDGSSLSKYKQLQKGLDQDRATVEGLRVKWREAEHLIGLRKSMTELDGKIEDAVGTLKKLTQEGSERYKEIRVRFANIVQEVLDRPAEIWIRQNDSGNLEFKADFSNLTNTEHTSEAEGTTYQKFLCMAFDLAVLTVYAKEPFFHFVYHDGALETLDNRRKLRWLDLVRRVCDEHHLQYIMTAIEDDVPRDEADEKKNFADVEIVRELHDKDDTGRIFRMPPF